MGRDDELEVRLELAAQVVGDGDHRCRATDDEPGRRADAREPADVPDIPAVRGDDERRAAGEGGDQARRHEEVGVHDVGPEAPGLRERGPGQAEVLLLSRSATVENGTLDVVSARRGGCPPRRECLRAPLVRPEPPSASGRRGHGAARGCAR